MGKLPPQSQEEALDEEDALLYAEATLHEEQSEQMLWPEDLFDLITTPSSVISLGHDPCPGVAGAGALLGLHIFPPLTARTNHINP